MQLFVTFGNVQKEVITEFSRMNISITQSKRIHRRLDDLHSNVMSKTYVFESSSKSDSRPDANERARLDHSRPFSLSFHESEEERELVSPHSSRADIRLKRPIKAKSHYKTALEDSKRHLGLKARTMNSRLRTHRS